jgi:hypothetical protein
MRPRQLAALGGYGGVALLIVLTYVLALLAERRWLIAVLILAQTGTVWRALRASHAPRAVRLCANVVFAAAILAVAADLATPRDGGLLGSTFLAATLLYLVAPFSIVRDLARREGVDRQTMFGALAAYLLLGMAFAFGYRCLGILQPGPFFGDAGDGRLSQCLFFSFVTLTTTGYGNLVPAGNPGQSLAVLEALVGQLFLVTAVAKIVDAWRPRGWHRPAQADRDPPGAAGREPPAAPDRPAAGGGSSGPDEAGTSIAR